MTPVATLDLREKTLFFGGRLERDTVTALWAAVPTGTWAAMDLAQVIALDTAGLALLVEIARSGRRAGGDQHRVVNAPAAFHALCAAYRILPDLEDCPDAPLV